MNDYGPGHGYWKGKRRSNPSPLTVKVFVVIQSMNLAGPNEPNCRIIATRLRRKDADAIKNENPGCWVEKHLATKDKDS